MPMPGGEEPSPPGEGDTVDGLDEQLDESLEDFDETVAGGGSTDSEIDILNPMGGGSSGVQSDEPLFEEGDLSGESGEPAEDEELAERAAGGAPGSGEAPPEGGEQSQAGGAGDAGRSGIESIPIPEDIGDGRDDDIVLRQIRDAAMKERDPVLREKLWDEYRRIRDQR